MLPRISMTAISKRIRSPSETSGWLVHSCSSTACTSSSIWGSAGAESSRRPGTCPKAGSPVASSLMEGVLHAVARPQDLVEVGELEARDDRGSGPGDAEVAARLAGRLQAGDQRPQARGVQEGRLGHVDHDARGPGVDELGEDLLEAPRGDHVETAPGGDHPDSPIGGLD